MGIKTFFGIPAFFRKFALQSKQNHMTTEKNDTAEGGSVGFFYFPVSPKGFLKLQEVCREILHPHGSEEPLTKEQYMKTLTDLGENCYDGMTGDHLNEG